MNREMKKRLSITAGILLLAGISLLVWQMVSSEPSYGGKPLSYWIGPHRANVTPEELDAALASMGDKAVPVLIERLRSKPASGVKSPPAWLAWFAQFPPLARYLQPGSDRREAAVYALGRLGPAARGAIPALEAINAQGEAPPFLRASVRAALVSIRQEPLGPYVLKLKDTSSPEWFECSLIMCYLGTNAAAAVPNLIAALQATTNASSTMIRSHACQALRNIHSRPDLCVPALAPMLRSPNQHDRIQGLFALAGFGSSAKPARAETTNRLADPNPWVRDAATNLLRQIDADAAVKAAVK
jgi:HEAT repeat protein